MGCRLLGFESNARVGEAWVGIGEGGARVRLARVVWVWVCDCRGCCYCGVRVNVALTGCGGVPSCNLLQSSFADGMANDGTETGGWREPGGDHLIYVQPDGEGAEETYDY